ERPFMVRMRDQNLKSKHQTEKNFPGRCCFSEQSEWINEFVFEQRLRLFTPTHYVFDLIDNFIEILGDSSPTIEKIANEISPGECRIGPRRAHSAKYRCRKTFPCWSLACRVVARGVDVARLNVSAFAKATARQSSLHSTTRAKTGGKGITLPLVHPIMFPGCWT